METSTKFYIGIDISKSWFDASVLKVVNHQKHPMLTEQFANTEKGIGSFKKWLQEQGAPFDENTLIVIENTGVYHRPFWEFCSKHNLPLHIGNAAHIKWSLGITRGKNDQIDSKRLCNYCFKQSDELKATAALDPVFMQLKDLMTSRTRLVTQLQSTKSYIKELLCTNDKALLKTLEKAHKAAIDGLEKSIMQIEKAINNLIVADEKINRNYELIISIPGIGTMTAIYIICCTNNFANKPSGKQLASYAGVVPFEHSSGSSVKGKNKVHKMANKELKRLLHMCAISSIKYSPEMKAYFERKKAEGKNGLSIVNAIKNKLLLRVVAVVNKQEKYVDNYQKAA
jgi:transposase